MMAVHLASSSRTKASDFAGDILKPSPPRVLRRAWTSGFFSALSIAALNLLVISSDTPAGSQIAYQLLASYPFKPNSDSVGISGANDERVIEVTPIALILPSVMKGWTAGRLSNIISTRPA